MKKTWIACAALASLASVAQAQSSVTLYGIVDAYVGRTKSENMGASVSTTGLNSGGLSTSRWGLSGAEDLGGGLKAIFNLEQSFNADNGTVGTAGSAFDRQSWVGLEGGFGKFQIGNTWTALDDVFYIGNSAFDSIFSPGSSGVMSLYAYNANPGNVVRYTSPNVGGFSGAVSYKGKGAGIIKQTDFNVLYEAGPLTAALGYQQRDNTATNIKSKFTVLAGAYDFGVATLRGNVATTRNTAFGAKVDEYQIGADVPLTPALVLSGGFARSETDGADKRTGFGLAATYALSKRTTAYVAYNQGKSKLGGVTQAKETIYGAGLRHSF
jgi:predicted porin